jgi:hypothetical protein
MLIFSGPKYSSAGAKSATADCRETADFAEDPATAPRWTVASDAADVATQEAAPQIKTSPMTRFT